ncbi:UNVERIFIED_CONTAM: hypothetical protein FKN15_073777 [Acipenser sinensis]
MFHRFLELESSGHRNEIRLHYRTKSQQAHTEVFPYILADNQWHKVSIAVSASHVILHVDCNRIYERVVETPSMNMPGDTTVWLGQRNNAHGSFKLSRAEEKMNSLDQCYCERTCNAKGNVYRAFESWTDGCKNCTCMNGTVQCETLICPPLQCAPDSVLAYVNGACCKECQPMCIFSGRVYLDEERQAMFTSSGVCLLHECRCMDHSECMNLEAGACCSCKDGFRALREDNAYCEDIDECAEGRHYCRENTMCVNTAGSFLCICNTGYIRIDDYSCTGKQ